MVTVEQIACCWAAANVTSILKDIADWKPVSLVLFIPLQIWKKRNTRNLWGEGKKQPDLAGIEVTIEEKHLLKNLCEKSAAPQKVWRRVKKQKRKSKKTKQNWKPTKRSSWRWVKQGGLMVQSDFNSFCYLLLYFTVVSLQLEVQWDYSHRLRKNTCAVATGFMILLGVV